MSAVVIDKICVSSYADLFLRVCGYDACATKNHNVDASSVYDCVGLALASYEGSSEVNQFTSKYDAYLQGKIDLTSQEKQGLNLFKSEGKCAGCHIIELGPDGSPPLLTDYTYDNLGVPRNPDNPFYGERDFNSDGFGWIDLGLGGFLDSLDDSRADYQQYAAAKQYAMENYGKQKVPTLRNVAKGACDATESYGGVSTPCVVKSYTHNGYFKTLWQVVHFYNTRDIKPPCLNPLTSAKDAIDANCWPAAEVPVNVNTSELGDLHLTLDQEEAIVAFMKTLSDGYTP